MFQGGYRESGQTGFLVLVSQHRAGPVAVRGAGDYSSCLFISTLRLLKRQLEVPRVLFLGICLDLYYFLWRVLLPEFSFDLDWGSVSQALVEPCLVPP